MAAKTLRWKVTGIYDVYHKIYQVSISKPNNQHGKLQHGKKEIQSDSICLLT